MTSMVLLGIELHGHRGRDGMTARGEEAAERDLAVEGE